MAELENTPRLVETPTDSTEDSSTLESGLPRIGPPPADQPSREATFSKPSLLVIAVLAVALLWTAFSLRSETLKSAALEANVTVLEAEVAQVEASVSAHQERLESVRNDVGELLARVGALNSLVFRDVIADDLTPQAPLAQSDDAEALSAD